MERVVQHIVDVKENDQGQLYVQIPPTMLEECGINIGDEVEMELIEDGDYFPPESRFGVVIYKKKDEIKVDNYQH